MLKITVLVVLLISSGVAVDISSEKSENAQITIIEAMQTASVEVEQVRIKDSGVEHNISVPKSNSTIVTLSTNSEDKLNSKNGLMVRFADENISVESFETLFNIKLKEKLQSGFYIFENQSELTDVNLIELILNSDRAEMIQTLRPNWKMGVRPF